MHKSQEIIKYKCITAVLAFIAFSNGAVAETVSQKQASTIAQTFFNAAYGEYVAKPKLEWNGRQLTTDRLFSPFYVYNHPKGGFVIISADTKAYPVLGYSRTSKFERNKLTEDEKELLAKYAHEVELVRYDSSAPENAVAAWRNLPLYIIRVLNNPYDTPEFSRLSEGGREMLEAIDRRNSSIMMPSAVEFDYPVASLFRSKSLDDVTVDEEDEIVPFLFFEEFLNEVKNSDKVRLAELEELWNPSRPVVSQLGGGHISVNYPENIPLVYVYNLSGTRSMEKYFKETPNINLDLSALPQGFYVLMAGGESGKIYGTKIYR